MKCLNCGAEIGNNKICDYCGSHITVEMQKEQEQLNKNGCPKCGSTNITFKRENQGEVRKKNSKKVIHKTIGICKDCGTTWDAEALARKEQLQNTWGTVKSNKKVWKIVLWALGWIYIFPLPLTLILRKKPINNLLKYSIIILAWIIYFGIGIAFSASALRFAPESFENISNDSVVTNVEEKANLIDVDLQVEPQVNDTNGSVLFKVTTNLPEDTKLMVTVKKEGFTAQDNIVILADKTGCTSEFSDNGKALKGDYVVTVSMSLPKYQKAEVQEIIGKNGENITGKYVHQDSITSANSVSGDFEFTF